MKVFGRKWEYDGLGKQYQEMRSEHGFVVLLHLGERALLYTCQFCRRAYRHWLCDDRTWRTLPKDLWLVLICQGCFVAVRGCRRYRARRSGAKRRPMK